MDFQSLIQYQGMSVKITLFNNFWYRAKIISVTEQTINFISEDGKNISVSPSVVMMIIPMGDSN